MIRRSLRALASRVDRLATVRLSLVLLLAEVLLLGAENTLDFPLSVPYMQRLTGHVYLDMCAFCSAERIHANLAGFGDTGRQLQLWLMATIDIAIPVTSAAFGVVAITVLSRRFAADWVRWLILLPLCAMVLDFAENGAILGVVTTYPHRVDSLATLTGLLSGLKLSAYTGTALTIVALLLAGIVTRRKLVPR